MNVIIKVNNAIISKDNANTLDKKMAEDATTYGIAKEYLVDADKVDSIILGCTHYPLIKKYIKEKEYRGNNNIKPSAISVR